jgi:flagellar biosynthesis protein FliQ
MKKIGTFLLGFFGVALVSFLGGLIVSIIGHYSKNGEFGYSLFIPTIFMVLAITYFLFSWLKAFLVFRMKK